MELGGLGERVLGFANCHMDAKAFPKGFQFDSEEGYSQIYQHDICFIFFSYSLISSEYVQFWEFSQQQFKA